MRSELTILLLSASTALMAHQAGAQENDGARRGYDGYQAPSCEASVGALRNSLGESFICDDERAQKALDMLPKSAAIEYQGNGIFCGPLDFGQVEGVTKSHFMLSADGDLSNGVGFVFPMGDPTLFVLEQDKEFHGIGQSFVREAPTKSCGKLPPMM